jgi:flagellin-like hook-associated protein FlgL
MNNRIVYSVCFLLLAFMVSSCEKVIDIDLEEADRKYVIEGNISNLAGAPAEVRLSQTKNFNDNNSFAGISGATVRIQVNGGVTYILSETSPGVYTSSAFTGVPGNVYALTVTVGGNTFTSTSTMPVQLVALDGLSVSDFAFGGNTNKIINPSYLDPTGRGNSYRLIQYVNAVQTKRVFVQNDDLSDGLRITRPLVDPDGELKSGDAVRVQLLCIDSPVYTYWYSLDQAATGNNQSATPANPVSNISGGALGYFSAHSVTEQTITVP